jgi:Protein kinase domain
VVAGILEKGTTVAGFRIDGILGQGGMGVVYEATQLSLNRVVALKVLASHLSDDASFRQRFIREGQVQGGIEHPHIVTVYDSGASEHGLFLAMRLIRGPNLKDMIISRELDAGRTLRIITPVADALDAAHAARLIHRDIKPQNILVGRRDQAYLADFGLTKASADKSLTRTGQFVGTLDYISPEQIKGERATKESDVYALAGVLYECLTGVVPFPKESEAAVLYAHMADPPPRLSDQRPDLPAQLDAVFAKAMAKQPSGRHGSAGELLNEVNSAFSRRIRAALTPPGPIEVPEETGIRQAETTVPTQESPRPDVAEPAPQPAETRAAAAAAPDTTEAAASETTAAAAAPPETAAAAPPDSATEPPPAQAEPSASAEAPAAPAPSETRPTPRETSLEHGEMQVGSEPEDTRVAGPPKTRVGAGPDETRAGDEPDETRVGVAPPTTKARRARPTAEAATAGATAGAAGAAEAAGAGAAGGRSTSSAVVERERRKRRRLGMGTVGAIGAAALAVVIVGFLIGSSGGGEDEEPAGSRTVSAGALDLRAPDDWRPAGGATAIPGLEYAESTSLTPPGGASEGTMTAGLTNARGRSLLPASFVEELGGPPPMTDGVKLGDLEAYRYTDLRPSGFTGRLTVYVAPTSEGVATVACSAPASSASRFMPACEGVATTLDLTSGTAYPYSTEQDYRDTVDAAIRRLDEQRRGGRRFLRRARNSRAQSAAAQDLVQAYARAREQVASAEVTPTLAEPHRGVVTALRRTQAAYKDLSSAARRESRGAYSRARGEVSAGEKALERALARLDNSGG